MADEIHSETVHFKRLNSLCRLCGERSKKAREPRVRFCRNYATKLWEIHGIFVEEETDGTLYSSTFCFKCLHRLRQLMLKRSAAASQTSLGSERTELEKVKDLWTKFDPSIPMSECSVCMKFASQSKGGRPFKPNHGRKRGTAETEITLNNEGSEPPSAFVPENARAENHSTLPTERHTVNTSPSTDSSVCIKHENQSEEDWPIRPDLGSGRSTMGRLETNLNNECLEPPNASPSEKEGAVDYPTLPAERHMVDGSIHSEGGWFIKQEFVPGRIRVIQTEMAASDVRFEPPSAFPPDTGRVAENSTLSMVRHGVDASSGGCICMKHASQSNVARYFLTEPASAKSSMHHPEIPSENEGFESPSASLSEKERAEDNILSMRRPVEGTSSSDCTGSMMHDNHSVGSWPVTSNGYAERRIIKTEEIMNDERLESSNTSPSERERSEDNTSAEGRYVEDTPSAGCSRDLAYDNQSKRSWLIMPNSGNAEGSRFHTGITLNSERLEHTRAPPPEKERAEDSVTSSLRRHGEGATSAADSSGSMLHVNQSPSGWPVMLNYGSAESSRIQTEAALNQESFQPHRMPFLKKLLAANSVTLPDGRRVAGTLSAVHPSGSMVWANHSYRGLPFMPNFGPAERSGILTEEALSQESFEPRSTSLPEKQMAADNVTAPVGRHVESTPSDADRSGSMVYANHSYTGWPFMPNFGPAETCGIQTAMPLNQEGFEPPSTSLPEKQTAADNVTLSVENHVEPVEGTPSAADCSGSLSYANQSQGCWPINPNFGSAERNGIQTEMPLNQEAFQPSSVSRTENGRAQDHVSVQDHVSAQVHVSAQDHVSGSIGRHVKDASTSTSFPPDSVRRLEDLRAPLTKAEEIYLTHLVKIKLASSADRNTVTCKTRGQPVVLKRIVKPRKASGSADPNLRKRRAHMLQRLRADMSGLSEADYVEQHITELKVANRGTRRKILETAGAEGQASRQRREPRSEPNFISAGSDIGDSGDNAETSRNQTRHSEDGE